MPPTGGLPVRVGPWVRMTFGTVALDLLLVAVGGVIGVQVGRLIEAVEHGK